MAFVNKEIIPSEKLHLLYLNLIIGVVGEKYLYGIFSCKQPDVYLYGYLKVICMEIQKHLNGYFFLQTTKIRRQRADV